MSNYHAGRRAEYRAMKILMEEGYVPMRTAGSHGPFDIIALRNGLEASFEADGTPIARFIQIKRNCKISKADREKIRLQIVPPLSSKEVWSFMRGSTKPTMEAIEED